MALASTTGAIDYTKFDGSRLCMRREDVVTNVLERERVATWMCGQVKMHAVLARGLDWLKPKSAAKVSEQHSEHMADVEERARMMCFPYVEKQERQKVDAESALDRYKQVFGGEPGSEEAEETIAKMKEQYLPKKEKRTADVSDGVIARGNSRWADAMKPRAR